MKTIKIIFILYMLVTIEIFAQSDWINCKTERYGMDFLDSVGVRNYEVIAPPR